MKQIKIGAILSYLSIIITMLVTLIYTPVMIRMLGQSEYGLYALVVSFAGYLSILDMGLGNAIVRYISRNRVLGDSHMESKLIGLFFRFFIVVGFLTIIIGSFMALNVEIIFGNGLTIEQLNTAKTMIIILTLNFALSFPLSIFGAIIQSYEKYVFMKIAVIIKSIIQPIIILIVLISNYGVVAIVITSSLINLVFLIFNYGYCKKYLKIKISFEKIDRIIVKEIMLYSIFIFLTVIVDKIYWQTDQVLLGIFKDTETVAVYALAIQFIGIFLTLSTAISSLFLPKISMMVAKSGNHEELSNLFVKVGRIQFIILGYALCGFIIFGNQFITLWVGYEYNKAYIITLILLIPFMIDLIQNIGIIILQAKNLFAFRTIVLVVSAVLNILISIYIIDTYGSIGTAVVTGFFIFLGNGIVLNYYFKIKLRLNIKFFWKNILKLSVPMICVSTIYYLVNNNMKFEQTLLLFIIEILNFSALFFIFIWKFGVNKDEKTIVIKIVKSIFKKN